MQIVAVVVMFSVFVPFSVFDLFRYFGMVCGLHQEDDLMWFRRMLCYIDSKQHIPLRWWNKPNSLGCAKIQKTAIVCIYRIYSRNSCTFLTKILYLNLGCVIYARKRFYVGWGCLLSGVSLTVFLGLTHSCPYIHPVSFKQACTVLIFLCQSQSGSENSFSRFWKQIWL